jgi:hypothetical protein
LQQEVGLVATTSGCTIESQENEGTACFRRHDGANYVGNPAPTNEPLAVGWAPTRLIAGYDRLVFFDTSLGLRAGYAFAGEGPTLRGGARFVPWSFAARATHWFGNDPLARTGLRPFSFITAGYAMFDIRTSARVREDPTRKSLQGGNELEQTVDFHKRAGDGFAGLGGGLQLAITHDVAIGAEVALVEIFPFRATVMSGSAGPVLGF